MLHDFLHAYHVNLVAFTCIAGHLAGNLIKKDQTSFAYRQRKMQANADKYPAELCRGSSAKYTSYNRGYAVACEHQP